MTLEEKLAQLGSVWMGAAGDDGGVAPMQDLFFSEDGPSLDELIKCGMGQLTRVFGTRPVSRLKACARWPRCRPGSWRRAGSASPRSRTRSA